MSNKEYDFLDLISILSFYLGYRNLIENEQQSKSTDELIKKNNINVANDKQAKFLLEELGRKFDEQNAMLKQILEVVRKNENN